jgi:hypothetical protein
MLVPFRMLQKLRTFYPVISRGSERCYIAIRAYYS